jgi:hypothetical protein
MGEEALQGRRSVALVRRAVRLEVSDAHTEDADRQQEKPGGSTEDMNAVNRP